MIPNRIARLAALALAALLVPAMFVSAETPAPKQQGYRSLVEIWGHLYGVSHYNFKTRADRASRSTSTAPKRRRARPTPGPLRRPTARSRAASSSGAKGLTR